MTPPDLRRNPVPVLTFSIDDLRVQSAESLRAEEASILAELAELNHDAGSAAPAETAPAGAQAAIAVLPQIPPPPRGFGMGTGQLLWGNSRAANWQGAESTGGARESVGGGAGGLAHQDMNPLADAAIGDVTAL